MSAHKVESMWMGGMKFNALVEGHTIVMDTPTRVGGTDEGPIPKPFLLTALSGCTGMDVLALLKKQNIALEAFEVDVTGELTKSVPIMYSEIAVNYTVSVEDSASEAVVNAVKRSQGGLCGVIAMIKQVVPISWKILFNGKEIASGLTTANENTKADQLAV